MLISYYAHKKSSPRLPSWQPSLISFNIPIESGSIIKPCTLKHFQVPILAPGLLQCQSTLWIKLYFRIIIKKTVLCRRSQMRLYLILILDSRQSLESSPNDNGAWLSSWVDIFRVSILLTLTHPVCLACLRTGLNVAPRVRFTDYFMTRNTNSVKNTFCCKSLRCYDVAKFLTWHMYKSL